MCLVEMKTLRRPILTTTVAIGALLAACGTSAQRATHGITHASKSASAAADAGSRCLTHTRPPLCYAPKQFRVAYGVQPLLNRGIDGRGRTVVLLEFALPNPTLGATVIEQDLSHYESRFGIPAAGLEVVSGNPSSPSAALATPEEVLDVEAVHAIAPGAGIRVVLVELAPETKPGVAGEALVRALDGAVTHNLGDVISLSVGAAEHCVTPARFGALHSVLRAARDRHITVVAATGDLGAAVQPCSFAKPRPVKGVELPAADSLVTAVGGTRLLADPVTGRYVSETAWNRPPRPGTVGRKSLTGASGGGFSSIVSRPSYQAASIGGGGKRGIPDVAADADLATGLALLAYRRGQSYILPAGGTSASAPLWAALAAMADQYAGRRLGFLNPGIHRIARSPHYHAAFHDITKGQNTELLPHGRIPGYRAGPGWDPVTGWGSPNAQVLVPLLARFVRTDDGSGL
jgi:subtilase family serine protease